MRLGIRGKQIAGVTALVGVVVVALSAMYVATLADMVLQESHARGELLKSAILERAREIVLANEDPYPALRDDRGLRAILQSSWYGQNVTGAAILDTDEVVIAHADADMIGRKVARETSLDAVIESSTLDQLGVIYDADGRTLELRDRLQVGDDGTVWYTDYGRGYLGAFDPATREIREWKSPGENAGPYGIAIGTDGRIWYCESRTGRMVAFDPKTEKMAVVPIPTAGAIVRHMETDSTRHRVWLALSGTGRLGKIEVGGKEE